jgi:hypothetical protein
VTELPNGTRASTRCNLRSCSAAAGSGWCARCLSVLDFTCEHLCLLNMAGAKCFALAVAFASLMHLNIAFQLPSSESVLVIGPGGPGASQSCMRTFERVLQQKTPDCAITCTYFSKILYFSFKRELGQRFAAAVQHWTLQAVVLHHMPGQHRAAHATHSIVLYILTSRISSCWR